MKTSTLWLALLTALTLAAGVQGQTPTTAIRQNIRPTIQQKREDLQTQRCTVLTQNIDTRIARFNNNKDRHLSNYNTAKQRLSALIAQLEAKGYDVAKLKEDAKTWDAQIQKFAADYQTFITKLTETKNYACGDPDGFRKALNAARQLVVVVRQDAVEARNFYQTVIRADVQALKSQTPTPPSIQF